MEGQIRVPHLYDRLKVSEAKAKVLELLESNPDFEVQRNVATLNAKLGDIATKEFLQEFESVRHKFADFILDRRMLSPSERVPNAFRIGTDMDDQELAILSASGELVSSVLVEPNRPKIIAKFPSLFHFLLEISEDLKSP